MHDFYDLNLVYHSNTFFINNCDHLFVSEETKETKSLFHYTSTEVLNIILKTCSFRATNIFYLNDSKEYITGVAELKKIFKNNDAFSSIIEKMETDNGKSFPGLYTISFSKEADSLHQWITYAKESGVAIELDFELLIDSKKEWVLKQDLCGDVEIGSSPIGILKPLKYFGSSNLDRIWEEFLTKENDLKDSILEQKTIKEILLRMIASYIKNDSFKGENEFRITVFPIKEKDSFSQIKYFPFNGTLRPFLEVSFAIRNQNSLNKKLPIKSITIGPSGKQQAIFDSVVHRIKYGKLNVYEYAINYEGLINNFADYINELLCWLDAKGYKNYIKETISINKDGTYGVNAILADKSQTEKNLLNDIEKKLDSKWYSPNPYNDQSIDTLQIKTLVEKLIFYWIKDNKDYLSKIKNEKNELIYNEAILHIDETKSITSLIAERIIHEFKEDYYFSKEGMIIKKSKIPYIF